jgi:AcrR family transcriptional regulator
MPIKKNLLRKTEIYKKAASLFNKNGFGSTSVRQICRSIGIRESSLYHYIRSKEDLLYNICENGILLGLEAIEPVIQSNLRPDQKLEKMIEFHIITIAKNRDMHSTMLKELRSLRPKKRQKIIKLRDQYEAKFRRAIADCTKEGLFRNVDIKITALGLLGMMNWLIHWYSPSGKMKSEDIAKIFSDLFFKGSLCRV